MRIKWFNQKELDVALTVLFKIYPQNSEEVNDDVLSIKIIKPEIIDFIIDLEACNYCGDNILCIGSIIIRTIIKGHPLFDGNKRFGMLLGERFLNMNGYRIRTSNKEYEEVALNLANGIWDKEEVYEWLLKVASPYPEEFSSKS